MPWMKNCLILFILLIILGNHAYAQEADKSPLNSVGINTLGLINSSFMGNYQHLFGERHGLFIEGGMESGGGYKAEMAYFRHRAESPKGKPAIERPFWGPFVRFATTTLDVEDPDTDRNYDLELEALNVGILFGRSFNWGPVNFTWRFGYGYPLYTKYKWTPDTYDDKGLVETITTIFSGIESGLSIVVVF